MKLTETKSHYIIKGTCACESCDGTGLYKGMAERGESAVVCHTCNGTGSVSFTKKFPKFKKRKIRKDVKRVFQSACGYCITDKDVTTEEGKLIRFSKFGADYADWLKGVEPKPIEDLHCPYLHTGQQLQCSGKDVNDLYKNRCSKHLSFGNISDCKCFKEKHKCWDIYNGKNK